TGEAEHVALGPDEQLVELEERGAAVDWAAAQQVAPADRLLEASQPQRGEMAARLLRDEQQVVLHHLRRPGEQLPQLGPLRRDPDGTRVDVTRAYHQATLGQEQRGAEADLVGAEQRGDEDVASRLDATVDADAHPAAQPVLDERPLRVDEPELPRRARVLDRRERARAGAAVAAGDVDDVRKRLHDARGDE